MYNIYTGRVWLAVRLRMHEISSITNKSGRPLERLWILEPTWSEIGSENGSGTWTERGSETGCGSRSATQQTWNPSGTAPTDWKQRFCATGSKPGCPRRTHCPRSYCLPNQTLSLLIIVRLGYDPFICRIYEKMLQNRCVHESKITTNDTSMWFKFSPNITIIINTSSQTRGIN